MLEGVHVTIREYGGLCMDFRWNTIVLDNVDFPVASRLHLNALNKFVGN